jgi:preprotein translocase subunit SecA
MSRFYVSVQDDLMIRFGSERMEGLFQSLGDTAIESKTVTKSISSAQRRVEGNNYDARKSLLEYDDVMRQQRETMYEQRNYILENEDVHSVIHDMFSRVISDMVASHINYESKNQDVDVEGLVDGLKDIGFREIVTAADLKGKPREQIIGICLEKAWAYYENKIEPKREQMIRLEKQIALHMFDRAWSNHIDTMDKLRSGIGLRSYAQSNPLQAYVQEGYELFQDMMRTISQEIVSYCMNVPVGPADEA